MQSVRVSTDSPRRGVRRTLWEGVGRAGGESTRLLGERVRCVRPVWHDGDGALAQRRALLKDGPPARLDDASQLRGRRHDLWREGEGLADEDAAAALRPRQPVRPRRAQPEQPPAARCSRLQGS